MPRLKGAVVGFGNIAALGHWPAYAHSTAVEIVAIAEPSPERQKTAQALQPDLRCYADLDALLAHETLDFIDLCTPPSSHVALAQQCLQKGIHVLCEKPLALDPAAYNALAMTVEHSGKVVFTVHNWKYSPIFQSVLQMLRSGAIGPVWHAEIFTLRNSHCKGAAQGAATTGTRAEDWRKNPGVAGGGILIDHGWHAFYLLMNLVNAEPQKILTRTVGGSENATGLEEVAQALVQFPQATGYLHLTWQAQTRRNTMLVQGRLGSLFLDDDRLFLTTHAGKREEIRFKAALSAGSHHADWFELLFPDFLAEIENNLQRGKNFKEAGWCTALTSAAYQSSRQGSREMSVSFPNAQPTDERPEGRRKF